MGVRLHLWPEPLNVMLLCHLCALDGARQPPRSRCRGTKRENGKGMPKNCTREVTAKRAEAARCRYCENLAVGPAIATRPVSRASWHVC